MSGDDGLRAMGPCTECHAPHQDCAAPAYCCDDCLHLDEDWEGYASEDYADVVFELAPMTSTRLIALPAAEVAALRAKAAAADRVRELLDAMSADTGIPLVHRNDLRRALDGGGA